MMTSWSNQGGYPLVTVKRNYEDGSFTLSQKTYLANATLASDKKWFIPINYVHESDPDFRKTEAEVFIGDTPEVRIDGKVSSDDWLILNKQSTGYYRIMYDEQNWRLIIKGLKEKFHKIHPRNRAQLMHDAYSFATTDRMQHEILFELLTYLPAEDQYAPWSTANGILTGINRYLTGDSEYGEFKFFVAQMVETIYEKLGVNDIPGEQHYQPYIRSIAINLACLAELPSCIYETNQKLSNLMENQIPIEPNLQSQTYCNGVRSTTDNTYNFVFEKLMKSDDQAERRILISSLGCSQTASQIRKFVNSSIDHSNELRTQERYTILSSAYSRGEVGLLTSIEFLEEYHEEYAKLEAGFGGGSPLSNDILSMSQYVTNKNQEEKVICKM